MKRFAFLLFPLLCFSGPAISADLDGPVYRERETVIERPLPPRIVEKRVIEHHYYEPVPVYERRIYTEPRAYYAPRVYAPRPRVWAMMQPAGTASPAPMTSDRNVIHTS